MCGIFGIYREAGVVDAERRVKRAILSLEHRGGDGSGIETGERFAFGHTRLSLVALGPTGAQPMWNAQRTLCIVFAGEVYNHEPLRKMLAAEGLCFRGRSDAEVILVGYERYGMAFFSKLDGMFAIGLYDVNDHSCLLIRDRFGVKPMFYRWNDDELVFSIEPGPLNQPPYHGKMAEDGAISSFLNYRFTLGEETLWNGVRMLQPGYWLQIRNRRMRHGQWSSIAITAAKVSSNYAGQFENIFKHSVNAYATADAPVGIMLSGGLDSSSIAAALHPAARARTPAFTARIASAGYNESGFARQVARKLSIELTEVAVEASDQQRELDHLTLRKGFPIAIHNEVAVALLARAARKRVKAAMSGEGADELAGGYARLARIPFEAQKLGASPCDHEAPLALFLNKYGYFPLDAQLPLLRPRHAEAARAALARDEALLAATWRASSAATPFGALCATMTQIHLPILLHSMDAMTMAENLELRTPFTSPRVAEMLLALPDAEKLAWRFPGAEWLARRIPIEHYSERLDRTKGVVRTAFGKHLPHSVVSRRKQGFPVPWGEWVQGALRGKLASLEQEEDSPLWDIFDRRATASWFAAALNGRVQDDAGKRIWMMIGLERWMRLQ